MNYTPLCSLSRIVAVLKTPRLLYFAPTTSSSMVFTAEGKLLGIVVSRKSSKTINASSGRAAIATTPVILPASEIKKLLPEAIEAAKKAPVAKPAPKPTPKPEEPTEPQGPAPGEV